MQVCTRYSHFIFYQLKIHEKVMIRACWNILCTRNTTCDKTMVRPKFWCRWLYEVKYAMGANLQKKKFLQKIQILISFWLRTIYDISEPTVCLTLNLTVWSDKHPGVCSV